jgi:segregation and condensation protein B
MSPLARQVVALLFCSPDPVSVADLAEALEVEVQDVDEALAELRDRFGETELGIVLREVAGGYTFASDPEADVAVRRLLSKPRTPPLSQAQAECLAIVAYLQPVSRPEIARIRGVNSDSPVSTLEERGLIEEKGRSQFGAILYKTAPLFEKLFGLEDLTALPDFKAFEPSAEDAEELRTKLLKAGEQRSS